MAVQIIEWRPVSRNTLRGWAVAQIGRLVIRDVGVHVSHGRAWCSLPSKPQIDGQSGAVRRDENGKIRYLPVLEWSDRTASDRFNAGLLMALEIAHPGATR